MAFSLASNTSPSLSISDMYAQCIQSLGTFVEAIREPDCLVRHLELVRVSDIVDEYGRARIWGDQTKACLPEKARGSLDDTLRRDADMRSIVLEILHLLLGILKQATPIADRKVNIALGSDQGSVTSVSDESDCSSDADSDCTGSSCSSTRAGADSNRRKGKDVIKSRRRARICVLVDEIKDQIQSLFDVSSLLRRPRVTDKYLHSVTSKSHSQPGTLENESLMTVMNIHDERHIMEKVLQWRHLNKNTLGKPLLGESDDYESPATIPSDFDVIQDTAWFCRRLAQANTRRREQLKYWKRQPYETILMTSMVLPALKPGYENGSGKPSSEAKSDVRKQKTTITLDYRSSTTQRTISTAHSFSTAAFSDVVHNTNTVERAYTTYAPTAAGQGRVNIVPDPPKTDDGVAKFPCPYCGMELNKDEMQNRQAWKRHVFHDLRPYVCTFKSCSNGSKLFASRNDWIYHEFLVHRRRLVCNQAGCDNAYSTRSEIVAHLQRDHYAGRYPISSGDLAIVVDLCDRPIDITEPVHGQTCIVCHETIEYVDRLQKHLAGHMEDIALFVLPSDAEQSDKKGTSHASFQVAAGSKAESHRNSSASFATSVGISKLFPEFSHDPTQDAAGFAAIMAREEDNLASKMSNWNLDVPDLSDINALFGPFLLSGQGLASGIDDQDPASKLELKQLVKPTALAVYVPAQNHPHETVHLDDSSSPDSLSGITSRAFEYVKQGLFEEAEKLFVLMETRKARLGVDHPDTLRSMANLASTYWNQGRWVEAEKLFMQVMETRKTKLGVDHPDTLTSMANLASMYKSQGRWEEAEKLFKHVMEIFKTKLGIDHPDTLTSMADLALTWRYLGRHTEALALMKDCALACQRILGPEHPYTMSSVATLKEWS